MTEYLDVCTEEGIPTGETVERKTAHSTDVCHRTAHVWIIRKEKGEYQILMQKRAEDKDSFPGCYDTSSAGHIPAGCEPLESAIRELYEELGITAIEEDFEFAGTFRNHYEMEFYGKPFKDNEVSFVYIYDKPVDADSLSIQKEELSGVEWFDLEYVYDEKLKHNRDFCVPIEGLRTLMKHLKLLLQ